MKKITFHELLKPYGKTYHNKYNLTIEEIWDMEKQIAETGTHNYPDFERDMKQVRKYGMRALEYLKTENILKFMKLEVMGTLPEELMAIDQQVEDFKEMMSKKRPTSGKDWQDHYMKLLEFDQMVEETIFLEIIEPFVRTEIED